MDEQVDAVRIYAKKDAHTIDISYCQNVDDAVQVFKAYESAYDTFYVMAQNGTAVYHISDRAVFDAAGFTSFANDGIQYIDYSRK